MNNFIFKIIEKDISSGKYKTIRTRFPPEPNGYLHIGHAKSIFLNFGIAEIYKGKCNLRFDDTNPTEEKIEFINSIKEDINWLGFNLKDNVYYSSNYFNNLYQYAIKLILKKLAYVDKLSPREIHEYRGTLTIPGKNSPYRNQSVKDNLSLFKEMKDGKFNEGDACLRAKIDMKSSFMVMRDPILYRIKFAYHHQTGNRWCIYPTYDFSHCISDAIEKITHSLCTLEFQDNRRLYDWILRNVEIDNPPKQYEFSRLNLNYTVTSKRKLKTLVEKKIVDGWDDPRMPTICGMRRRGYTPFAIRRFCNSIGLTKQESIVDISLLENYLREDLNKNSVRSMAVINPIKLIIISLPIGYREYITVLNHPQRPEMGTHKILFSRELYIDKYDFQEKSNIEYKRLVLEGEVRLRNSYIVKAKYVEKDIDNQINKIFCTHDPSSLRRNPKDGRKIKGVIHWVSSESNSKAEFRLYDRLFIEKNPLLSKDFLSCVNPNSLIIKDGFVESHLISIINKYKSFQFEREGYFCVDSSSFKGPHPIFNRIVKLKSSYKKFNS